MLGVFYINKSYAQSKIDCSTAKTQMEINRCAQNEFETADKELNEVYKKLSVKLDGDNKLILIQSQRKWVDFRDEYCKVYSSVYKGGSIASSAVFNCKTETTRARIKELKTLFDQVDL